MTRPELARQRLRNERLIGKPFTRPEEVVAWLGAVQSQDYAGAKWGVAQRIRRGRDARVEAAFQEGKIIRTHVLRPTWHFVMPADLRWMLALTAPRVNAAMTYYNRILDLDDATFGRTNAVIGKALQGGKHLTRPEIVRLLAGAGITGTGQRMGHLLVRAELDALICSGSRRGKQHTYALVDERVPPAPKLARDEALAELTRRYFTSHGPALLHDFAWWSGLTVGDARQDVAMVEAELVSAEHGGKVYWSAPAGARVTMKDPTVHLLPNYDELLVAYKDHSVSYDPELGRDVGGREMIFANHLVLLNGIIVGGWRRTFEKRAALVETKLLMRFDAAQRKALAAAADRYGEFLDMPVRLR